MILYYIILAQGGLFMEKLKIYKYDENIAFRQCSLAHNDNSTDFGNCSEHDTIEKDGNKYYSCKHYGGIHIHCAKHSETELIVDTPYTLFCPKCKRRVYAGNFEELLQDCLKILNRDTFKGATLIHTDKWYVPELKKKVKSETGYWLEATVESDQDEDTTVVLYIGKTGDSKKSQFFIKPEKLQLASDHKDLDPATLLTKIEVTLKDRTLKQEYDS